MGQETLKAYQELAVYGQAFEAAMALYWLVPQMLLEEEDLLGQQLVAAARSVCGHLAEAWSQRHCYVAFVEKLNEAQMMAATVETWLAFAMECGYVEMETGRSHCRQYRSIFTAIATLVEAASDQASQSVAGSAASEAAA